jgi:TBC1 domain family member 25
LKFFFQKNEKGQAVQFRKFSVDPQITSLEVLYSILAKAFEIKTDFGISYTTVNPNTKIEEQLIIFSDWDLDAAFLR